MILKSVEDLLCCFPNDVTAAEFRGKIWCAHTVRTAVIDALDRGKADLCRARILVPSLLQRLSFVIAQVNSPDKKERSAALERAFGVDWNASPSPLLVLSLLTESLKRTGSHPTESEWDILGSFSAALLDGLSLVPRLNPVLVMHVSDGCRVFSNAGAFEMAAMLAEQTFKHVQSATSREIIALPDVLDALYVARAGANDASPPVEPEKRKTISIEMLRFLNDDLGPAIELRNTLLADSKDSNVQREIARSRLALRHRVLTQRSALAISENGWSPDMTSEWLDLAAQYDALGDANGHINYANAIASAIDGVLEIFSAKPNSALMKDLHTLADNLEQAITRLSSQLPCKDRRALMMRVVKVKSIQEDCGSARVQLEGILESLENELGAVDEYTKSYILAEADDYLGLALRIAKIDDRIVRRTYVVLRGIELNDIAPSIVSEACVLRAFVTRVGSCLQFARPCGSSRVVRGVEAHNLALALNELARMTRGETRTTRRTKKPPFTAKQWREHLDRLAGRIGMKKLAAQESAPKRLILEADGLAVHIAMSGIILDCWPNTTTIAASRLGHTPDTLELPGDNRVAIADCFPSNDPWSQTLARYALHLKAKRTPLVDKDGLSAVLSEKASLIILGAHGIQDGVTGRLTISIGEDQLAVDEVFSDVRFATGSTVIAAVCYGGSGQGHIHGRWSSLPEYLLNSGARWVLANRWPAWTEQQTESDFIDFLEMLRKASVSHNVWSVPEATTAFMARVRSRYNNPRQWAGWSAWTNSALLTNEQ